MKLAAMNLASDRFKIGKTYKRKTILRLADAIHEDGDRVFAMVANKPPFVNVVFEFDRHRHGSKMICCGLGRSDRYNMNDFTSTSERKT